METPKRNTNKQPSTSILESFDSVSTPGCNKLTNPQNIKHSRAAGNLNKKMAKGLASLYDEVEEAHLESPIYKHGSLEVMPPSTIIDLCSPETTSAKSSDKKGTPLSRSTEASVRDIVDVDVDQVMLKPGSIMVNEVRNEWAGTSQFFIKQNVEWQKNGQLDNLILYLKATQYDLSKSRYDPSIYIDLSRILSKIGFTDIGLSEAYRAVLLVEGFRTRKPELLSHVREVLSKRLRSESPLIIDDEIRSLHLQAYRELLNGLLGCGCFWDGIQVAKTALEYFPGDPDLLETRQWLKDGFVDRHHGLQKLGTDTENLVFRSRVGKLYQKSYPWIDKDLFKRKPALVRQINKNFGAGNCEVRKVLFGSTPSAQQTSLRITENQDMGPLGVFATRNINEGDLVLVDQCLTVVSDVPSSRLEHCDACHASLKPPFHGPWDTRRPSCCGKVAFCSHECFETATKGYHSVVCGKDFDWLHQKPTTRLSAGAGYGWYPIMFVRFMGIIIADRRAEIQAGKKPTHPLQHYFVARMTANYSSNLHPEELNDWSYHENVIAPTKILMMLGINIFTDPDFSQEVIQTLYWRMLNNASMSICDLSLTPGKAKAITSNGSESPDATHMICLNSSYLFFNHSCDPNISWHGAIPNPHVGMDWLIGYNSKVMKPGSSAVFCAAARDIKKGEELKISYVGDPKGEGESVDSCGREQKRAWLKKWFEGGCGCDLCVEENERMKERRGSRSSSGGEGMDLDVVVKLEGLI